MRGSAARRFRGFLAAWTLTLAAGVAVAEEGPRVELVADPSPLAEHLAESLRAYASDGETDLRCRPPGSAPGASVRVVVAVEPGPTPGWVEFGRPGAVPRRVALPDTPEAATALALKVRALLDAPAPAPPPAPPVETPAPPPPARPVEAPPASPAAPPVVRTPASGPFEFALAGGAAFAVGPDVPLAVGSLRARWWRADFALGIDGSLALRRQLHGTAGSSTLRLGALGLEGAVRRRIAPFEVGAGPLVRLHIAAVEAHSRDDRFGQVIRPSLGFGALLTGRWALAAGLGAYAELSGEILTPRWSFTIDGSPGPRSPSALVAAGLGLSWEGP